MYYKIIYTHMHYLYTHVHMHMYTQTHIKLKNVMRIGKKHLTHLEWKRATYEIKGAIFDHHIYLI